jgi:hypothetical protein
MGFGETVVAMFGILCGTGLAGGFLAVIYRFVAGRVEIEKARATGSSSALNAQLQSLREEVRQLREQNADLILSFDTTLHRLAAASPGPNGQVSTPSSAPDRQVTRR